MTLTIGEETKSRLRSLSGNTSSLLNLNKRKKKNKEKKKDKDKSQPKSQGNTRVLRSTSLKPNVNDDASALSSNSSYDKVYLMDGSDHKAGSANHASDKNNVSSTGSGIQSIKIRSSRQSGEKSRSRSLRISTSLSRLPRKNSLNAGNDTSSTEGFNQTAMTREENTDPLGSRLRVSDSKASLSDVPSTTLFTKFKSSKSDSATPVKSKPDESDSGLFSSLISAAHNAANHLIPKSSLKSSSSLYDEPSNGDRTQLLTSGIGGTDTSNDPYNHTGSFLNHLDFLLAPSSNNDYLLKKATTLDTLNTSDSSTSSISQQMTNPSSTVPLYDDSKQDGNNSDDIGSVGTFMDKVKFTSVKQDNAPPISTFGRGNLTLDAIEKDKDDLKSTGFHTPSVLITTDQPDRPVSSPSPLSMPNDDANTDSNTNSASPSFEKTRPRNGRSRRPEVLRDLTMRSLSPAAATKLFTAPLRNSFSGRNMTRASSISKTSDIVQPPGGPTRLSTSDIPIKRKTEEPELQGIEYASAKRNTDFHTIFKDTVVSPIERLIADYSCALSKDILIQGRLYISDRHICFYSNILGWMKTVVVPFKEIVQIEQKNTAVLFPNAISIQTLHDKFLFASFISRDSTFDQIMDIWNQTIINKNFKPKRGTMGSADLMNDENLTLDSEASSMDYDDDDVQTNDRTSTSITDSYGNRDESDSYDDDDTDDINPDDMTSSSEESTNSVSDEARPSGLSKSSNSQSSAQLGPSKHEPTTPDYTPKENEREMGETILNAPLGTVINILYGSDVQYFDRILKAQGNYDISKFNEIIQSKKREYVYTKPISGSIGPSKTRCEITESIDKLDLKNYVQVTQVSKTPDIPSGNSFVVKTIFLFCWADDNSTKVKVYTYVDWSAKSWIKAAVEKGTFDGIKSSTKILFEELEDIIEENKGKSSSPDNRKDIEEVLSSLPCLGPKEHEPTECTFEKSSGYEIIDDKISFKSPVGTIFQLICGDDTSYMKRILERQKNIEISDIPPFQNKTRKYTYVKPLPGSIGPKQAKCYIEEKIESDDVNTCMVLEQISKTPEIPSGNSFEVHTKFYFSWGEKNTTNVLAATNIEWTGKSWIKSAIQKGSINGQKASVQDMVAEIKDILSSASSTTKRRPTISRRKTERSRSKRKTISKSREQPEVQNGGLYATVQEIYGIVKDLVADLPPIILAAAAVVLLILIIFVPRLCSSLFHRSPSPHFVSPSTIVMDGEEYYVLPAMETYYGRNRRGNKNKPFSKLYSDSEYDLWNWIDSHSGSELNKKSGPNLDVNYNINSTIPLNKAVEHKKQNLKEVIRLTELQLMKLKEKANLTDNST